MRRVVLAGLCLLVVAAATWAGDDPAAAYLQVRERLAPAPVGSGMALKQMIGEGGFEHIELVGDVSGKASAAPSLDGPPTRTLMMTLDDGANVALRAAREIDRLEVGHRISVIASLSDDASGNGDLVLTEWVYEWDLPEAENEAETLLEQRPAQSAPPRTGSGKVPAERIARPPLPRPAAAQTCRADAIDAWKSWALEQNSRLTDKQATNIVRWVLHYSQQYNVNHKLVFALIKWESWFDPGCVSHAGAIGLMQLMPGTARSLEVNPRNVQQNIEGGVRYLAEQLATYADRPNYERVILALACYNAGPNAVSRAGHRVPNITETQRYVKKVSSTFYELHQAGMP